MMSTQRRLARHCCAVLLRKKPASLFRVSVRDLASPTFHRVLDAYTLSHLILCDQCENALVLVYDPAALARCLLRPGVRAVLDSLHYPPGASLSAVLACLRARFAPRDAFPHEIGLFLGYPVEDVLGFMRHRGKHCKLCGPWKVYGDVSVALAQFAELFACKQHVLAHLEQGGSLFDLPML